MDNIETIKCHRCDNDLNRDKSKYKRSDFNLDWYYCNKCKSYSAFRKGEPLFTIGYSDEMQWSAFPSGFRMSFLKRIVREIDENSCFNLMLNEVQSIKEGGGTIVHTRSREEEMIYTIDIDKKLHCEILVGKYGNRPAITYNRLEEELKNFTYNFDEIDAQRRDRNLRMVMSWKRLAEEVNMTEPELKLILKNKTVRKLNAREIWLLSHWCGCKINGYGWKEIEDSPWYE